MERVGEHPVPAGPLAIRWLAYELPELRAGSARERARAAAERRLGDAGAPAARAASSSPTTGSTTAATRSSGTARGTPSSARSRPGEEMEAEVTVRAPQPPGRYRLAFDLVEEFKFWFAEIGSTPLELDVDVAPRIDERRLAVVVHGGDDEETTAALAAQEEPLVAEGAVATAHLVPGALPAPDWSRRVLDAHAEGFAAVGGSIEGGDRSLRPWAPDGGRNPSFEHPLLLPSLLAGIEPGEHAGLPAHAPDEEPWLFDGRIRLRLRRGRRRG